MIGSETRFASYYSYEIFNVQLCSFLPRDFDENKLL